MDYKSKRWAAKRKAILAKDRHQCRECRRFGLAVDASVVHHAWPAEDFPEYAWSDWNLLSLCPGCHNAMHDRDTGALTDKGISWQRRASPPLPRRNFDRLRETEGQGVFRRREKRGRGSRPRGKETQAWRARKRRGRVKGRLCAGYIGRELWAGRQ